MRDTESGKLTLGLQINEIDSGYSKSLVEGLSDFCRSEGVSLIVFSGRSWGWPFGFEYQNTAIYSHITRTACDSLIIAAGTQCNYLTRDEFLGKLKDLTDIPLVSMSVVLQDTPSIVIDNETGFRQLVEHLIDVHGCSSFAVLCGPADNPDAASRLLTLHQVLKERSMHVEAGRLYKGDFSWSSGYQTALTLFPDGTQRKPDFDAVIAFNDLMALGFIRRLSEVGIRVPEDVIVTGFDDIIRAQYGDPSLTTVHQNLREMGETAATYAIDLARGKSPPRLTLLKTSVRFRKSCGCLQSCDQTNNARLADGSMIPWPEDLFRKLGLERFTLEDDLLQMRFYLSVLHTADSVRTVISTLRKDLEAFGVRSAALVLYHEPIFNSRSMSFTLPSEARLVLKYDETTAGDGAWEEILFNPNESMLPENPFSARQRMLFATALYHREYQLGYLVLEPGERSFALYEALSVQIASVLYSTWIFSHKVRAEEKLRATLRDLESFNRKLDTISRQDEMTSLLNRRGFWTSSMESLCDCAARGIPALLFLFDMDGLKSVNDTLGHEQGDRAIKGIAEVLKKTFRSGDFIARLGGDEFAVLAPDPAGKLATMIDARIEAALEAWNEGANAPFKLSISYGYVMTDGGSCDLDAMIAKADELMYRQKMDKKQRRQ